MSAPSHKQPYTVHSTTFLSDEIQGNAVEIIEPAPDDRRAQRGRLYVLIELMGESPVRSQALRQMHETVEYVYYSAGGTLSTILEATIEAAHAVLADMNRRGPDTDLRAGICCTALVDDHMMIATAGPALALLATRDRLEQLPPTPSHYSAPLGGDVSPQVGIYRHRVLSGDVLFMGESDWILLTDVKTMGGAIAGTTRENQLDVVDYLRRQSDRAPIPGLLLVIEERVAPGPEPVRSRPAQPRPGGRALPTALGASPPVLDVPTSIPHRPTQTPQEIPARSHAVQPAQSNSPLVQRSVKSESADESPLVPVRETLAKARKEAKQLAGGATSGLQNLFRQVLPARRSDSPQIGWVGTGQERSTAPPQPPEAGKMDTPVRAPFVPPPRTRGSRARLFVLLALLIPLLAFGTVGAVYLQQGAYSEEEGLKLVDLAESQLLKAQQALAVGDKGAARTSLGEAQRYLSEAVVLIGATERIRELSQTIEADLQELLQIRRLYSLDIPLAQFPAGANPHRVAVFDQDVYVLDTGRQVIEHFRTDPSRTVVEQSSGVILREGDIVEGITVGRLVDIGWQPRIAGFADKASLLILDRNNNVFRYNRVDEATALPLGSAGDLESISQIESYSGRLYLADEGANQIWRYSPAGDGYDLAPDAWFAPETQVNLTGLVSLAIDSDIWLLSEDGTLLRYRQGQQFPFGLDTSAGLSGYMVDLAVDSKADGKIYLADSSDNRILVFGKGGNYIEQFVAAESDALQGLRGLYLDDVNGTLFILTQTSLYAQSLPR